MASFLLCLVHFLCCSTLLVNGQRTVSTYEGSESDEDLMRSLEEHDLKLRILGEQLFSTFGNLEVNDGRTIVRCLEEHDQNLVASLKNLSQAYENGDKKLLQELEKHTQIMKDIYHNTSMKLKRIGERTHGRPNECLRLEEKMQAVNKTLERKLEEPNERLISLYQNLSSNIDAKFDFMQNAISNKLEEHGEILELMDKNLSSKFKSTNEILLRVLENDENIQKMYERLSSRLQAMNESMVRSFRDNELKLQTIHDKLSAVIDEVNDKLNAVLDLANETIQNVKSNGEQRNNTVDYCPENLTICDCSTIRLNGYTTSGVYRIFVVDQQRRYYANAFCDMTTTNIGWTVFQKRKDGSENFYRGWNDYANGFGNASGEFWLGNDFLHLLTSKKHYKLRIDLGDFAGNTRYAEYSTFSIGSSTDKYRLTVGTYSGNAGDSLVYHTNRQFSTKDQDNDVYRKNCSNAERGAWWYGHCYHSNLNGIYYHGGSYTRRTGSIQGDGIEWYYWLGSSYSLKTTEMKISPY